MKGIIKGKRELLIFQVYENFHKKCIKVDQPLSRRFTVDDGDFCPFWRKFALQSSNSIGESLNRMLQRYETWIKKWHIIMHLCEIVYILFASFSTDSRVILLLFPPFLHNLIADALFVGANNILKTQYNII